MALSVERMSRLTTYVLAGSSLEQFIQDAKLTGEDATEAEEYWAQMEDAKANLKPGEQMQLPSDWT